MPALSEQTGLIILGAGVLVAVVGLVWLILRWLPILRQMIVTGLRPILVLLLGIGIAAAPIIINRFAPTDDRPKVNLTRLGDITLTGKAGLDYAKELGGQTYTIVQMANNDVTDATLELLKPMANLQTLDLSDTQVTDAGLKTLHGLTELRVLRLTRTKVSEVGVKELLAALPNLTEIDLRFTTVPTAVVREWKNAKPDVRKYLK
jgi:hypothetical protein